MPLKPGAPVLAGDVSETRDAAGDSIDAGAAVMIDANGDMTPADTEAGDLAGLSRHADDNGGRGNTLGLSGAYVAKAAAGVADGDRVNAGNTTDGTVGEFDSDAAGPAVALSDTGGTWQGKDVPTGHAVVHL